MRGGSVIVGEIGRFGSVIRLEPADELHRGAVEGVNVLVVVTNGEQGELAGVLPERSPGERRYQVILVRTDVLVFIHQDPAEPSQKPLPPFVRLLRRQTLAAQKFHRAADHLAEHLGVGTLCPAGEAGAGQPHRQGMASQNGHAPRVIADQVSEAAADVDRRVAVVGQGQDAVGVLAAHADQIGDPVDQHSRLARAGPGEHQHVGLFPLVGDDALLDRVLQSFDDGPPSIGRGLAANLPVSAGQPAVEERLLLQGEVVHRQAQRVGHGGQAVFGERHHHVDLQDLSFVVQREGLEVGPGEAASIPLFQADGHGRTKHRQALVEADDLLFVQPPTGRGPAVWQSS